MYCGRISGSLIDFGTNFIHLSNYYYCTHMQSIPFTIPNINHGFFTAEGLIKLEDDYLHLEYHYKDGIIGAYKGDVARRKIPVGKLEEVRLKRRLFSHYLQLRASSLTVFEDLPGVDGSVLSLKIARKYRRQADRMVSEVSILLSEIQLDSIE